MTQQLVVRPRRTPWFSVAGFACVATASGLLALLLFGLPLTPAVLAALAADTLASGALIVGLLARRLQGHAARPSRDDRHHELAVARSLVENYGEDSISPFIVRPDKSYEFAAGGVLAYRTFGRTAVVSGDPVGPPGAAAELLAGFLEAARSRNCEVVVYGASAREIETYHRLGLRSICVGEEAVVHPDRFSLEGRRVRKLRQSVHRIQRRGWQILVSDGVDIDAATESEIDALEARWRARRRCVLGFAMSMGRFEAGVHPGDLYVLARSPEGGLAAVMRFIAHRGKLSLDTMRRIGETPNGLNEALLCHALEVARARGISEVSLNYAGLAHLVRNRNSAGRVRSVAIRLLLALLRRRFQTERLVRFNEKFAPEWRPRYLVYRSRRTLPVAAYRVLQAEGYIAHRDLRAELDTPSRPARTGLPPVGTGAAGR